MNIFIPDLHSTLTYSFCKAFEGMGGVIYAPIPNKTNPTIMSGGEILLKSAADFRWYGDHYKIPNVRFVEMTDLPDIDIDVVIMADTPLQRSVWRYLLPLFSRRKQVYVVAFCGNEMPRYRWDLVENLLCADEKTWHARGSRVPNAIRYFPHVDYDSCVFNGCSDSNTLITCINQFEKRYPQEAAWASQIIKRLPTVDHQIIGGLAPYEVATHIQSCAASLHIKHEEGYGYSVIESLAMGRPIIAPRQYIQGRTMARWCIHGESALLFNTTDEAVSLIRNFFEDAELRHRLQTKSAQLIRQVIDNEEQTLALKGFINRLQPQKHKRLINHLLDVRYRHSPQKHHRTHAAP